MWNRTVLVFAAGLTLNAAACASSSSSAEPTAAPERSTDNPADVDLYAFFDQVFQRRIERSPMFAARLGIKQNYDQWDDISDARSQEDHALFLADLEKLRAFDYDALSDDAKLSYRLFEYETQRRIDGFEWRFHNYPVNQMWGPHTGVPAFLINYHRVDSVEDAEAYVARLEGVRAYFAQVGVGLETRRARGIIAPKFVFERVLDACRNVISGRPFDADATEDSTLLADFQAKLDALDGVTPEKRAELTTAARNALVKSVGTAYELLMGELTELQDVATTDDGAWKLPRGDEFYARALEWTTTTELGADEIHALGLAEVDRIHDEMRAIMDTVGFEGDLNAFFEFMRSDPQFYYPNTDEGRARYLAEATQLIETMKGRLPELFVTLPKNEIVVKRVEPFREKTAGKAFYNRGAPDGSRPGYYYANLYDMSQMPIYQMEALAYHEGIPGHHMQIAIAQELNDVPAFRRYARYTAYTEGWGLYSELVPKELGFYADPYSDFGRLAMELWRACRLVVDTGIHHKRWTRERAIEYLVENTPNPEGDAIKAIERYIVMPSQATAYKVGMLKILELRERAKLELGDNFSLREFHDRVLTSGPLPLSILEERIDTWIASRRTRSRASGEQHIVNG